MAYPQHWLLAFGGHQGHIEEQWVCGIRLAVTPGPGGVTMDEEQYLTSTALPALTAWFARADSLISTQARLTWIKFNEIGPEGQYADQTGTHERQGLNLSGGATSTNFHPLQCALVLSWRTDAADRGLASRGRIFSPRPMASVDLNGDVSGAQRVQAANSAVLLLNSLDVSLGLEPAATLRPAIVSRGRKTGETWGPGVANQIDAVTVDSALDIQRRRARQQTRETTTVPVVYS